MPLLCRKGDAWHYVSDQTRWLVDDPETADAFRDELWQLFLRETWYAAARKHLRISSIADEKTVVLHPGDLSNDSATERRQQELQRRLEEIKPFVYAWRCNQSRQNHDHPRQMLKDATVRLVAILDEEVQLAGLTRRIDRHYACKGDMLLLQVGAADETTLAAAVGELLGLVSEVDFYENLLRCRDDSARRRKLLSKHIPMEEIEGGLFEYQERPAEPELAPSSSATDRGATAEPDGPDRRPDPKQPEELGQPSVTSPSSAQSKIERTEERTGDGMLRPVPEPAVRPVEGEGAVTREVEPSEKMEKREIWLKESGKSDVKWQSAPPTESKHVERRVGDPTTTSDAVPLTQEQKMEIEDRGREFTAKRLSEMGYEVNQMPFANPGFDLVAEKEGSILHVEVKAHLGYANVVEVTAAEWRECLRCQANPDGPQWELWNIVNLSEDQPGPVGMSRYITIPEDALSVRRWRVDLRKCDPTEGQ